MYFSGMFRGIAFRAASSTLIWDPAHQLHARWPQPVHPQYREVSSWHDPLVIHDIPVQQLNMSIYRTQHRQLHLMQPMGSWSGPWSGSHLGDSDRNDGLRWRMMREFSMTLWVEASPYPITGKTRKMFHNFINHLWHQLSFEYTNNLHWVHTNLNHPSPVPEKHSSTYLNGILGNCCTFSISAGFWCIGRPSLDVDSTSLHPECAPNSCDWGCWWAEIENKSPVEQLQH